MPIGDGYDSPVSADLNGNGLLDLLIGSANGDIRYLEQYPTPTITSFTPTSGQAGTSVTITGTNLADVTAVTVNGTAGTITGTPTATSLSFTVGAGTTTGAVVVTAPGGTATGGTFTINYAPVIGAQTFSRAENSANNTVVGTVAASDPDAGQTLTYAITAGNTGGAFSINSTTGQLRVADSGELDFETTPSFALTVRVTDNGSPARNTSATITVNLTNVNEAPTVPTDANATANAVAENAANGTTVGVTAASTDPEGTPLSYSLTTNPGGRFAIDASTGVVTVANSALLNFETNTSHSITVQASDGVLTNSQSFTIQVTDVANSTFLSSTTEQITRGVVAGAVAQPVLRIAIVLDGDTDELLRATSFSFSTAGTTVPADVTGARLYYTGTSDAFATTTPFGGAVVPGTGINTIGGTSQQLQPGTNYFWLAYDVAANAAVGNLLDGRLFSLTAGGAARTPSVTAPAGARPVVAASEVAGTALRLDGTAAGYVDLGDTNPNLVLGPRYTLEVWVKPAIATSNTTTNGVLGYDPGIAGRRSPFIAIAENNRVEFGFGNGTSTTSFNTTAGVLTVGQWNHVVSTYDGATLRLYVNGGLSASITSTQTPFTTPVRYVGTLNTTATTFFKGDVDEVAMWTRPLSQNEIRLRRHLVLSGGETDLASYLQFNEASGNVNDLISGASGPLTGTGIARVPSTAPVGTGLSSQQTVSSNGSFTFAGTGAAISFTGVVGTFDVTVARLNDGPQGTPPSGLTRYYDQAYWIINKYGTGNFGNAAVTYSLSPTAISTADATSPTTTLRLLKRASNSDGAFDAPLAAAAANALAGTVRFNLTSFSQTVIGTLGSSPLPVELVRFTAGRQGADALLSWATASEKNNAYFAIERSLDGRAFQELGQVPGHGSPSQGQEYAFTDRYLARYAAPLVYYRLRQVDQDGTASYSPVRAVTISTQGGLTLYPNPAHGATKVSGLPAGASVEVLDALGRAVAHANAGSDGTARLAWPMGLAAGMYVVRSGNQAQRLAVE